MLGNVLTCCNLVPEPLEFLDVEANIQRMDDETEFPILCRREDSRAEWADYNPNSDDYDVTTAPLLPASEAPDATILKQISALQGRIRNGGDACVLQHYQRVIQELQQALPLVAPPRAADLRRNSKQWGEAGSEGSAETDSTCLNDDELQVEETQSRTSDRCSRSSHDSLREQVAWLGDDEIAFGAQCTQFGTWYL